MLKFITFFSVTILTGLGLLNYPGTWFAYLLFTILLNLLLLRGFDGQALFFDKFIAILFWLGFWLKFTVNLVFADGRFPAAGNFDYSPASLDRVLFIISWGVVGFLLAGFVRRNYIFTYAENTGGGGLRGLGYFYQRHRNQMLLAFVLLFTAVAATNYHLGIYQRGVVTTTFLPFGLNGVVKWLLLFGLTSVSAIMLDFECRKKRGRSLLVAAVCLLEVFSSNVSMLSRGMVINSVALFFGTRRIDQQYSARFFSRFNLFFLVVFLLLFGVSVVAVQHLRYQKYFEQSGSAVPAQQAMDKPLSFFDGVAARSRQLNGAGLLAIKRWVGIDAVMAVASHPELGWKLWAEAWREKYSDTGTSFYDLNFIASPYLKHDLTRHHFISLPGIMAFFFYPGSVPFLFASMFLLGLLGAGIEVAVYRLTGMTVLCSLMSLVVAYRYAHFGYAPGQSYLLFGSMALNVLLICAVNWLLLRFAASREE